MKFPPLSTFNYGWDTLYPSSDTHIPALVPEEVHVIVVVHVSAPPAIMHGSGDAETTPLANAPAAQKALSRIIDITLQIFIEPPLVLNLDDAYRM